MIFAFTLLSTTKLQNIKTLCINEFFIVIIIMHNDN
jgi:hypothetical protein